MKNTLKTQEMKISVGFDKLTLITGISEDRAIFEIQRFKDYNEMTGNLKIEEDKDVCKIELVGDLKGIEWSIQRCGGIPHNGVTHSIEVTIDPKLFLGIKDQFLMCNESHLNQIKIKFNSLIHEISYDMSLFSRYIPYKIIYGINFNLKNMGYKCSAEHLMTLIRMAELPLEYIGREYEVFRKPNLFDHYLPLESDDSVVRCYKRPNDIICFEVACGYRKLQAMMQGIINNTPFSKVNSHQIPEILLSHKTCKFIVSDYFASHMSFGNYYKLEKAIKLVKKIGYNQWDEAILIDVLVLINKSGGIKKVAHPSGHIPSILYSRVLRDLMSHNINPITIPDDWPFDSIPALSGGYMDNDKNDG